MVPSLADGAQAEATLSSAPSSRSLISTQRSKVFRRPGKQRDDVRTDSETPSRKKYARPGTVTVTSAGRGDSDSPRFGDDDDGDSESEPTARQEDFTAPPIVRMITLAERRRWSSIASINTAALNAFANANQDNSDSRGGGSDATTPKSNHVRRVRAYVHPRGRNLHSINVDAG